MEPFNFKTVKLQGSNLIEASAGTGKTYSVAMLALRLLLEKKMPVNKILMVTFTNAAVAELEARIRLFVRLAYKVACGNDIEDQNIKDLVALMISNSTKEEVLINLKKAINNLDETSIQTIHSFCLNILSEFAFETRQIYGANQIQNIDDLIADQVNEYWRTYITTIKLESLEILIKETGLNRMLLQKAAKESIANNKTFFSDVGASYDLNNLVEKKQEMYDVVLQKDWVSYLEECANRVGRFRQYKDSWLINTQDPKLFYSKLNPNTLYQQEVFEEEITLLQEFNELKFRSLNHIYKEVIEFATPKVKDDLNKQKLMTFDDLISNVHEAIFINQNEVLIQSLRDKFTAVFIDEFQDTDKFQYEIFSKLFENKDSILFYIGDPKQSIYGWRRADIKTYLDARESVNHTYTMNVNFRSAANYVDAMNAFFLPAQNFDTFHYATANQKIEYQKVTANNTLSHCSINDVVYAPLTIFDEFSEGDGNNINEYKNLEQIETDAINLIKALLTNGKLNNNEIIPSNLAVLVRSNKQAKTIKNRLSKLGIPAITQDDQKVLESDEARHISYLLESLTEVSSKKINKALLNSYTGITSEKLAKRDFLLDLSRFKNYTLLWKEQGVYPMLMQYLTDYKVKSMVLDNQSNGGERAISNLYQIAEILQRVESERNYTEIELLRFLKRNMESSQDDSDEYTQRIESDEEAVKIVTIHKSKGLEYDIVIAPFMDLTVSDQYHDFTSFRADEKYMFAPKGQLGDHRTEWETQTEQENRRLFYVALTRAKYSCFLFKNDKESTLDHFYQNKQENDLIKIENYQPSLNPYTPSQSYDLQNRQGLALPAISLSDRHWRKMSYSYLSGAHAYNAKPVKVENHPFDSYDQFILKDLPKGAHIGNLLHNIFEFLDFTEVDRTKWKKVVDISLSQFLPRSKGVFDDKLMEMAETILDTTINIESESFKLSSIKNSSKVSELEFDFMSKRFKVEHLSNLEGSLPDGFEIHTKQNEDIEGVLNGKIDLFFEHNNKYYILDWKSNFLGDEINDYEPTKLVEAMSESNYHLQYLIYTLAVKKYLTNKIEDFDYEKHFGGVIYLFLRGVRVGKSNGVFTYKPKLEIINNFESKFNKI